MTAPCRPRHARRHPTISPSLRTSLSSYLRAVLPACLLLASCSGLPGFTITPDPRTPQDIDGDGMPNELDEDMDGDGLANDADPDADSDGRFDHPVTVDFPFDHNAFIQPLVPPNHPNFNYTGRLILPAGHIDISDIIRVNQEGHPLEFLEPRHQPDATADRLPD